MSLQNETFRTWLQAKKPSDTVGRRLCPSGCPIALHLKETQGGDWIVTGSNYLQVELNLEKKSFIGEEHQMPMWGSIFIGNVDRLARAIGDRDVSAEQALKALDAAEAMAKEILEPRDDYPPE